MQHSAAEFRVVLQVLPGFDLEKCNPALSKWHPTFLIDARLAAEAYSPSMNLLSSVSVSTYLSLLNLWLISRQNP
jgi:hypothetical protein